MELLFTALVGVYGLLIGSFLNVVIWRVPRGESVIRPRSACPGCATPIAGRDNIPVVSWLVLRGRCRACSAPISVRYPLVELGTGALFAATAWWCGLSWALPAFLYLAAITVALTMIDIDVFRLPDAIVKPSYLITLITLGVAAAASGSWTSLQRALLGGLSLFAFLLLTWVVYPKGMGMGDVKLVGVLGMYLGFLGWPQVVVGIFAAFALGSLITLPILITRGRKSRVPFGPFLLAGCYVGLIAGEYISNWYLAMFQIA